MNVGNQRKMGAILSYVSIVMSTIVGLLYTPFLVRMLGQSEYGLYSLVSSIIGYLTIMDFGFGNAIIVYTSKYRAQEQFDDEKKLHGMFNLVFKIIGVIAAILGLILYFNVDNIFQSKMTDIELHKMRIMMLILSFNLFLTFYFAIYQSIITAYEKFTFQKIIAIVHTLLKPLIMLPLLFLGYKSIALCVVITITNFITLMSNYIYCKRKLYISTKFLGFDKKIFKIISIYSIWIFLGVIVDKINWSLDNFILGAVSGTAAVSVYSIGATINNLFINLSTAVSGVLLPKVSKMIAKNASDEELTNEFIKVGRIQFLIIFLMVSGLIIVGKEFFNFWVGSGFDDAYYVCLFLIIPVSIPLIQNLGISIRQAKNKHKFSSIAKFCVALINLLISIPLSKKYGAIGASAGTCIGLIVSSAIQNIYYHKVIKINIIKFWKNILLMTIPFIIPWSIILLIKHYTNINGILNVIIYGGLFTVMYCVTAYLFSMNKYEKDFIKVFVNKILIRRNKK